MDAQTYTLKFDEHCLAGLIPALPQKSGIYCVYACTYNASRDEASANKLLYIGESENIRDRIDGHEKWNDWEAELRDNEILFFSCALISPEVARERAEAAMIFKHKPPCNEEYVDSFPFDTTTINTTGANALLEKKFTV